MSFLVCYSFCETQKEKFYSLIFLYKSSSYWPCLSIIFNKIKNVDVVYSTWATVRKFCHILLIILPSSEPFVEDRISESNSRTGTARFVTHQLNYPVTAQWRGKSSVNNGLNFSLFLIQSQPSLSGKNEPVATFLKNDITLLLASFATIPK